MLVGASGCWWMLGDQEGGDLHCDPHASDLLLVRAYREERVDEGEVEELEGEEQVREDVLGGDELESDHPDRGDCDEDCEVDAHREGRYDDGRPVVAREGVRLEVDLGGVGVGARSQRCVEARPDEGVDGARAEGERVEHCHEEDAVRDRVSRRLEAVHVEDDDRAARHEQNKLP